MNANYRVGHGQEGPRERASGRDGTRTHTPLTEQGILSPLQDGKNHGFSDISAPEGAVEGAVDTKIDADMQRVLDAWPDLPPALKAGILAMIDAAGK